MWRGMYCQVWNERLEAVSLTDWMVKPNVNCRVSVTETLYHQTIQSCYFKVLKKLHNVASKQWKRHYGIDQPTFAFFFFNSNNGCEMLFLYLFPSLNFTRYHLSSTSCQVWFHSHISLEWFCHCALTFQPITFPLSKVANLKTDSNYWYWLAPGS